VFLVSFDIVTPESAEYGDYAESGMVGEYPRLRDAIEALHETRTSYVDGVEAVEPSETGNCPRWVTVFNGREFETGAQESRSLHFPESLTPSTRARLVRLVKEF